MDDCRRQLLLNLKTVVEGLLSCQVANVWNVYGGLSRLHSVLERIFKHQFKIFNSNGEEDCWIFIEGLKWLEPSLATSPTLVSPDTPPPHPHTDKAMIWLHNSLETHTLSSKVAWLVSDEKHLAFCYSEEAFFRHSRYVEAALICLRAVEQNQLSLLTEIHPSLYLPKKSLRAQEKFHRRCSSFPDAAMQRSPSSSLWVSKSNSGPGNGQELKELSERCQQSVEPSIPVVESEIAEEVTADDDVKAESIQKSVAQEVPLKKFFLVKPWRSLPCLSERGHIAQTSLVLPFRENKTEPSTPCKEVRKTSLALSALSVNYSSISNEKERPKRKIKKEKRTAGSTSSGESAETIRSSYSRSLRLERKKKTFMEDGGSSIKPMSTGAYLPRPTTGQSLTAFLSFSLHHTERSTAELDRENAHFSVSEAIIAAIEQVKCNRWEKFMEEAEEESDEEIQELKQRIRLRRKIKQQEQRKSSAFGAMGWQASPTDNTTTDSFSPRSTDTDACSDDSISTDGVDDMEIDQVTPSNLADINKSGLSLSMASLYSEADLGKGSLPASQQQPFTQLPSSVAMAIPSPPNSRSPPVAASPEQANSAEIVALSLLSKFSDHHLPKASEIQWLDSDKENSSSQQMNTIADNIFTEDQDMNNATPLRGTAQWAPPRPQIIFTPHPPPQRQVLLQKQNLRCAGCGVKVAPEYARCFRYCEYLARYFCTGCHSNKQALIPGRILFKWDFRPYRVSNFAYNLLEQMAGDPLFNINDINPNVYGVKAMERIRSLRMQLHFLKDFLFSCKFAADTRARLEKEPPYMLTCLDVYSLNDLTQARNGTLCQRLSQLVVESTLHVAKCDLCQARGFMCELCSTNDIIFPWQFGKVTRCSKCFSCQHTACLRKKSAPTCRKCQRIQMRQSGNTSR